MAPIAYWVQTGLVALDDVRRAYPGVSFWVLVTAALWLLSQDI
ncbi:hypothetical protein [Serratia bockelmannii]